MWKILIIDDDFQVLEGMKKSIPWESIDAVLVGEASDGMEGLERVRETQPDIVITDIYMPVMNGLEMIERLREENLSRRVDYIKRLHRFSVCAASFAASCE